MEIINLTPHDLNLIVGEREITIPVSGIVARCDVQRDVVGYVIIEGEEIPVNKARFGSVAGLPEPKEDTIYIVSSRVAQALPERADIYMVDESVRNDKGQIVGANCWGKGLGGSMSKKILDACCGSRMFWFNKDHPYTVYMDNRIVEDVLCDGRKLVIKPDVVADFQNIPYPDNTFYLVVFDPPHLHRLGKNSWLGKKYGVLPENWQEVIRNGFQECMRVLKPNGTLVLKWNEEQIKLKELLNTIKEEPLFGNRRAKTHWLVFMKQDGGKKNGNSTMVPTF